MTTSLRRMSRWFPIPASVLLIVLGLSTQSAAEPVAITSGFFQVHSRINEGFFTLEGDGFVFTGGFDGIFGRYGLDCDTCPPGTPVELGSDFRISQGHGSAIVNGTIYSRVWFDGMTVSFQTPSTPVSGATSQLLTLPFTCQGLVEFFAVDPFVEPSAAIFSVGLSGTGRASALLEYLTAENAFAAAPEIRYDFGETADPGPEPSTMLLCGIGTAVLGAIRRRQPRQSA